MPWDKRRRCDLPLLQGDYIGEGGVKTSVNFLKITFQYLTLDIMHLGVVSRRTVLPVFAVFIKKDASFILASTLLLYSLLFGHIKPQNWPFYNPCYEPEKGWLIPENRVGPG